MRDIRLPAKMREESKGEWNIKKFKIQCEIAQKIAVSNKIEKEPSKSFKKKDKAWKKYYKAKKIKSNLLIFNNES